MTTEPKDTGSEGNGPDPAVVIRTLMIKGFATPDDLAPALFITPEEASGVLGRMAADGLGAALKSLPGESVNRLIQIGGLIVAATLLASLVLVDRTLVEARPLAAITAEDESIIESLGPEPGLVYSPSFDLIGPAAARAGIATLHGIDPFQLRARAEAIAQAAGVELIALDDDNIWLQHGTRTSHPRDAKGPLVTRQARL